MTKTLRWPMLASIVLIQGALAAPSDDRPSPAVLRATQDRFRAAMERVRSSIVRIDTVGGTQPSLRPNDEEPHAENDSLEGPPAPKRIQNPFRDSVGSDFVLADGPTTGVIYSSDGFIVTSGFNFARDPALISVTLADGRRLAADLVARDQVRKIALLKVDADRLPVAEWREENEIQVGQWAIALGMGFGGEQPSVTVGIISALRRMAGNAIQTDAKLSPANYGGPLCDLEGRVMGICVPMAQRPGELAGVEMYDSGVGFAVPRDRVAAIVEKLIEGRTIQRGWLGVAMNPRVRDAVVVGNIADPSPAIDAGLRIGDKIVGAAGRPVSHFGQLTQALYMIPAGEKVRLDIERDGESMTIELVLAESSALGALPEIPEPFDPAEPLPPEPIPMPEPEDTP